MSRRRGPEGDESPGRMAERLLGQKKRPTERTSPEARDEEAALVPRDRDPNREPRPGENDGG